MFFILTQIGVGPANGFSITGESETWSDFIGQNVNRFSLVKSYAAWSQPLSHQGEAFGSENYFAWVVFLLQFNVSRDRCRFLLSE